MESISYIAFYDSIVVIKKLENPRVGPYKRIVVGKKQPVAPVIDNAKKGKYYYTEEDN